MNQERKRLETIRGTRCSVELTKEVRGIPGFAPSSTTHDVGEVVFNFPHNKECVYFQPAQHAPVLEKKDIEGILKIMNTKFNIKEWE